MILTVESRFKQKKVIFSSLSTQRLKILPVKAMLNFNQSNSEIRYSCLFVSSLSDYGDVFYKSVFIG